jgi:hypothetical protein
MVGWAECNEAQLIDLVGLRFAQSNLHLVFTSASKGGKYW